ncbi:MAG: hypothetical protein QNK26_07985 [Moritella sp.]|uniref:hypothetical protein n=1 Tax=Moritella sp. TaxID=78556 RepID=UPI0029B96A26|nr:hypothetical protein [Moritella sp.]MDX2320524.1 hypothetical protein [Moritella sp.]
MMIKAVKLSVIAVMSIGLFACTVAENSTAVESRNVKPELKASVQPQSCSSEWFAKVESQVVTGDGQGHGPDLGSSEWRSVVEFKLGIRGDSSVPARDSDQWCDYINTHLKE